MEFLPFIELHLADGVDVRQEGLQRFRMGFEQVQEGDGAHGLGGLSNFVPGTL